MIFHSRAPQWQPLYNPLSNLVFSATGASVDMVICDGKIVMEGRELKTIDEGKTYDEIGRLMPGIVKKTGLEEKVRPKWPIV
jgi:5-methylthioadenosine/S-adenosylhomocysteine deaminase